MFSSHTEANITKLIQAGLTRKEAICFIDDANTEGGASMDIGDTTVTINSVGELTITG